MNWLQLCPFLSGKGRSGWQREKKLLLFEIVERERERERRTDGQKRDLRARRLES
jgi:hypothetical protein